jgi:hypothetical protein
LPKSLQKIGYKSDTQKLQTLFDFFGGQFCLNSLAFDSYDSDLIDTAARDIDIAA